MKSVLSEIRPLRRDMGDIEPDIHDYSIHNPVNWDLYMLVYSEVALEIKNIICDVLDDQS